MRVKDVQSLILALSSRQALALDGNGIHFFHLKRGSIHPQCEVSVFWLGLKGVTSWHHQLDFIVQPTLESFYKGKVIALCMVADVHKLPLDHMASLKNKNNGSVTSVILHPPS